MTTVTIQEAQSTLTVLIHRLSSGEEVLIVFESGLHLLDDRALWTRALAHD